MVEKQLQELGFSEKEAQIYISLNTYGPSPASTLAKRTNIKRGSIYDILNSLIEKNVVTSFQQGAYTYFGIDDIKKVIQQEKEKVKIAHEVVDILKTLQQTQETIDIQYYNGEEGYKEMYEDILQAKTDEIRVFIHLDNFHSVLDPIYEEKWTLKRIKNKIKARLIMQDTPYAQKFQAEDKKLFRETRLIQKPVFESTCILYSDYITLFDAKEHFTGIRIHHKNFANMFSAIFNGYWEILDR